ncbi:hypothetical protein BV898_06667 [Hypsibius exemplaris]|uniref:Uncharacterized protein n=1 Tax=Hypsibius exemplaris TaxID=2072580 RepID=A0A1W0WVN0_HYPEX|nr:hypothetical protein BV898_06667 [Hypsibius exemplaris]
MFPFKLVAAVFLHQIVWCTAAAAYDAPPSSPSSVVACRPDGYPILGKVGNCSHTAQLDSQCWHLEISTSVKDCAAFDGQWCCYATPPASAITTAYASPGSTTPNPTTSSASVYSVNTTVNSQTQTQTPIQNPTSYATLAPATPSTAVPYSTTPPTVTSSTVRPSYPQTVPSSPAVPSYSTSTAPVSPSATTTTTLVYTSSVNSGSSSNYPTVLPVSSSTFKPIPDTAPTLPTTLLQPSSYYGSSNSPSYSSSSPPSPVTVSPYPVTSSLSPATTSLSPVTISLYQTTVSSAPATTSPSPVTTSPYQTTVSSAPATASPYPVTISPSPAMTSLYQTTTSPSPVTASPSPVTASPSPVTTSSYAVTASPSPTTTSSYQTTVSPSPATTSPSPATTSPSPATASPSPATASTYLVTASPSPVTASPSPAPASSYPVTASPSPITTALPPKYPQYFSTVSPQPSNYMYGQPGPFDPYPVRPSTTLSSVSASAGYMRPAAPSGYGNGYPIYISIYKAPLLYPATPSPASTTTVATAAPPSSLKNINSQSFPFGTGSKLQLQGNKVASVAAATADIDQDDSIVPDDLTTLQALFGSRVIRRSPFFCKFLMVMGLAVEDDAQQCRILGNSSVVNKAATPTTTLTGAGSNNEPAPPLRHGVHLIRS